MKEVYCKLCGYRGGAEETSCPDCGAPLFEAPPELPETAATEARKVDIIKKRRVGRPSPRHVLTAGIFAAGRSRLGLVAGFLAASLALQGLGLWQSHRPRDRGWSFVDGDRLVTDQGVWPLDGYAWLGSNGKNDGPCRVLTVWKDDSDGSGLTEVWFYDGKALKKTDWINAILSGDGQVVFYQTGQEGGETAITRRDLRTSRETEVARGQGLGLSGESDYAGTALTYYSGYSDTRTYEDQLIGVKTHLWQLGAGSREPEALPLYLGKHADNYWAILLPRDESGEVLYGYTQVVAWNGGERYTQTDFRVMMDRDLTAVLYLDDNAVWRYEDEGGRTQALEDLPGFSSLTALRSGGGVADGYYNYLPQRLTDQLYQANGQLYYLDEDLAVTLLTPSGTADQPCLTADGQTLYYIFRPQGRDAQLWRLERSGGGWEQSLAMEDKAHSYAVSLDGQTLCARCWEGKNLIWKIRGEDGTWQALENIHPRAANSDVVPMDGGGCWYRGEGAGQHRELWYRAPDGEMELKMAYTAVYSSTFYPTDQNAQVLLPGLPEVEDVELITLGRGDQALVRVSYTVPAKEKSVLSAYAPVWESEADYWLLSADGEMKKLEVIES